MRYIGFPYVYVLQEIQHKFQRFQLILYKKANANSNAFGLFYMGKPMQIRMLLAHFILNTNANSNAFGLFYTGKSIVH